LTVAAVFLLAGREVSAQFDVSGPGSTVAGDLGFGLGAYSTGLGIYNLDTAMGYSIWTDAVLRQNAALELGLWQQGRRYYLQRESRRKAIFSTQRSNQTRLTESPTESDVLRGDALNFLVRKIADLTVGSPSLLRLARVRVPGGTMERAPLVLPSVGVIVSSTRMTAREEWPLVFRGPAFDRPVLAYHHAIDQALEAVSNGSLQSETVEAVALALDQLEVTLNELPGAEPATDRNEAYAFLRDLDRSVQFLRNIRAERVLNEILTYGGTTVGDLIAFLSRSNLQFGPAETPAERALYRALYPLLAQQYAILQSPSPAPERAE
jgi:hypothetical protein